MFRRTQVNLTVWFAAGMLLALAVTGALVYTTASATRYDRLDDEIEARARTEERNVGDRVRREGVPRRGTVWHPSSASFGYFYALVDGRGGLLATTPGSDEPALPGERTLGAAAVEGGAHASVAARDGEPSRIFVMPLTPGEEEAVFLVVGRSRAAEDASVERLRTTLLLAGAAGLAIAVLGGSLVAGRALLPIRRAMDSQRSFVANASHQLRTPVAIIQANGELLKSHADEPLSANQEAVDDIIGESARMGRLVGRLLTLAQVDAGQARLQLDDAMLDEVCDEAVHRIEVLAAERGVRIVARLEPVLPVRADTDRLRELLDVLLENALDHSPAGGTVTLVAARGQGSKVTMEVSDEGEGIPEDALPHVFDRFFRAPGQRSSRKGAGLGLAIARWICEAHGGSIRARSRPGEGARFIVEFPAAS